MSDAVSAKKKTIDLSIVLPAYKEKENLAVFVPQIEDEFRGTPIEIIVVDDNSRDGTSELLGELNKKYRNIIFIERPGLLGIGSALRDGYNKARGEYILSSDADLSFGPKDMQALYKKALSGFDMVLGYKIIYKSQGSEKQENKNSTGWFETFIASPLSNLIIGVVSGLGLKNYNTNFRVIRASTWRSFRTSEDRQFFLLETIIRAKQHGARIGEIPVTFYPRKFGESKVSFFKQAPKYFLKLLHYKFFD